MPTNLEREYYSYETDGSAALRPEIYHQKPHLRLLNSSDGVPNSANITSFTEFKTQKLQEIISQKRTRLLPSGPALRNLRTEIISELEKPKPADKSLASIQETVEAPKSEQSKTKKQNILNGFNSQGEMDALYRNLDQSDTPEARAQAINENLANMRRYHDEYTKSNQIVENPLKFDDDMDLANSDSGYKLLPMISEQERKGAPKDSFAATQKMLKEAKEGDIIVSISGPGGSETYYQEKEIIYTEGQTYVYRRGKGKELRALTFIADLTLEQCIKLYQSFAEPDPVVLDENAKQLDRVSELARRPVLITGGQIDFAGVLKRIEDTMEGKKVMRSANGKNRTFEEAYQLLELGEKIHNLPERCKRVMDQYQNYLEANIDRRNDPEVKEAIRQRMDIAMLEMTRIINNTESVPESLLYQKAFSSNETSQLDANMIKYHYQAEIAYLLTRPGCNGSGEESDSLTGQSLGDILSGNSGGIGRGGEGLDPICILCRKPLCEGRCFPCERKNRRAA